MPKILLVEDNEMNRDMLSRRLEKRGYQVVVAVDGQQGIDLARAEVPSLILMDMSLPGVDGWEATRQLKAAPATRAIAIIALTAHAMSGDRERALEAGADDFDTKPVGVTRVVGKIEGLVGRGAGPGPRGEGGLEAGADDFDTKPVDLTTLLEKIEPLLARRPAP